MDYSKLYYNVTGQKELATLDIREGINNPMCFVNRNGSEWSLLSSYISLYLIHRYAPFMHFVIQAPETTYADMYKEDPQSLVEYIYSLGLHDTLVKDVEALYKMTDDLEIQVKELNDYQSGNVE